MDECYFTIDGRESKLSRSCQLSLTGSDIIEWSGGQKSSFIITCFYTVYKSQNLMSSSRSDPVTVQISTSSTTTTTTTTVMTTYFPAEAVTSTTKTKAVSTSTTPVGTTTTVMTTFSTSSTTATTTTTVMITSVPLTTDISGTTPEDKDTEMWQIIWWSAVACSVIVLTGLICLCKFACKKRSKRQRTAGDSRASEHANIYSLITSVPDTSKPTDSKPGLSDTYSLKTTFQPSGLKQPQSHQQSKPETYSLITSTSQPSDVLVNTQHKKGPTAENENVYHVYCTIPDKPVRAVAKHQIYSLAI
nr:uncharacterized protein LOC129427913 isoform X2 [Misgurnus anguillicaudatus]